MVLAGGSSSQCSAVLPTSSSVMLDLICWVQAMQAVTSTVTAARHWWPHHVVQVAPSNVFHGAFNQSVRPNMCWNAVVGSLFVLCTCCLYVVSREYDRMSAYELFASSGVTKKLYDSFLAPMLLVTLFAPPTQLSAAAALGECLALASAGGSEHTRNQA